MAVYSLQEQLRHCSAGQEDAEMLFRTPLRAVLMLMILPVLLSGCSTVETHSPDIQTPLPEVDSPWTSVVVTGSMVNLRAGPGTHYEILGQVVAGDTLMVTGGLDEWYRVYLRSRSLFAWIYGPLTTGTDLPR